VSPDDSTGIFSFHLQWLPSLLKIKIILVFHHPFLVLLFLLCPWCVPVGVQDGSAVHFRGQGDVANMEDGWRIVAGVCGMCSTSVMLEAVGRTGAVLVSRWEKPGGRAGPY